MLTFWFSAAAAGLWALVAIVQFTRDKRSFAMLAGLASLCFAVIHRSFRRERLARRGAAMPLVPGAFSGDDFGQATEESRPASVPLTHDGQMDGIGVVIVFGLSWIVPIVLIVYLFRTLGTIVDGLRSINAGVQRTAAAVEVLAGRAPPVQ